METTETLPSTWMDKAHEAPTLFTIVDVPVNVKRDVWKLILPGWAAMTWLARRRRPGRGLPASMAVGALYTLAAIPGDAVHVTGHIVSALYAGAPMDAVLVAVGMPRTLYANDDVPPQAHIMRAVGGPLASAMAFAASLLLRALTPPDSLARELTDVSCATHGLIMSAIFAPLQIVDGGVVLKWALVMRGCTPDEADEIVQRAGVSLGVAAVTTGAAAILTSSTKRRRWLGWSMIAGGAFAIAAALGKVK